MFSGLVSSSSTFPAIVSFPINMGRYSDLGERLVIISKSQGSSSLLPFLFVREYRCSVRIVDPAEGILAVEGKESWEWDIVVFTL